MSNSLNLLNNNSIKNHSVNMIKIYNKIESLKKILSLNQNIK